MARFCAILLVFLVAVFSTNAHKDKVSSPPSSEFIKSENDEQIQYYGESIEPQNLEKREACRVVPIDDVHLTTAAVEIVGDLCYNANDIKRMLRLIKMLIQTMSHTESWRARLGWSYSTGATKGAKKAHTMLAKYMDKTMSYVTQMWIIFKSPR
ncbi:unnamed protein product [Protopolystoma xenopodis]|uniref:Uncharacterized protein n=1 Tax=Protopolystoma xenopodis TaxID=117903 RepID=A0A3S5A052_9PLAT|nr:unnamed protein product [Protopolystoma xenopodis]